MIKIFFNSEEILLENNLFLADFFMQNKILDGDAFAVAINRRFVPKHYYQSTPLQEGDRVEIIMPMQGG
jgi:sulfur carrier protein